MTMLDTRTSSMVPPRPRRVLMRMPRSVSVKTQFEMTTFRTSPLISLPMTTPPWPWAIVQFVIVTFSSGARMGERPLAVARPPRRARPVDRAAPDHRHVAQPGAADERRVRALVAALPARLDDRVVVRIVASDERRAGLDLERDVVAQEER